MKLKEYELIIKKSRFIAISYEVHSKEEVKDILDNLKLNNKKAKHIPYAYKIGSIASKSDDKEPSGTAGNPIYNLILKKNKDNILVVVIRYFGGTKLGAGGLLRAYLDAAKEVI